ncbi:UNVERIFIED_CONTAM: hypothetical protein FKN15_031803 [Acipenser sinensis]
MVHKNNDFLFLAKRQDPKPHAKEQKGHDQKDSSVNMSTLFKSLNTAYKNRNSDTGQNPVDGIENICWNSAAVSSWLQGPKRDVPAPVIMIPAALRNNKRDVPAPVIMIPAALRNNKRDVPAPVIMIPAALRNNKRDIPAPSS